MDIIKALWRGNIPLVKTFWLYGFSVTLLLVTTMNYFLIYNKQALSASVVYISIWVLIAFSIIYFPYIFISIWRSANKYQGLQLYAIAAKIIVIFVGGRYLMEIFYLFDKCSLS